MPRVDLREAARLAIGDLIRWVRPAAVILAAGLLVALVGGGYWWGHSSATARIQETETGLAAAFANGPEAARQWWSLMAWNDPREALAQCQGRAVSVQGGRRACAVPLWIEAPPAPAR